MRTSAALHEPLVSVVVPTYGRSTLLERALRSVLAQTYSNWELLVVDDNESGSSARAETERLLARYEIDPRVHYIRHETNAGGSQARNTGISAAEGAYVAFLDDDDEWLPTKLEVQCRLLEDLPQRVAAAYCGYSVQSSALARVTAVPACSYRRPYPRILVDNFIGTTSTLICRKSALEEIGMFDTALPAAQDRELLIRLCRSYEIACVNEPLVRFNWHDGARVTKQLGKKLEAQETLYRRYAADLKQNRRLHSRYLVEQAKLQLQCDQAGKATRTFLTAWLADPVQPYPLLLALISSVNSSFYERVRLSTWRFRRPLGRAGRYR